MAPTSIQAVVTKAGKLSKEQIPVPKPADNQALVKISHVAQNPTDVQSLDGNAFGDGAVLGCDFVGTVEQIGSKVTRVKQGDIIAGLIWGGEIKGLGGYSEYTVADEKICFPLPAGLLPEQAATVPLAACTALLALFSKDCLAIDKDSKPTVLVWGGSSSVGLYAVQIAKLYGLNVITTCSARNHDHVRLLGVNHVFDYRDADVVDQIRKAETNLKYVFDTIGNETSSITASQAIAEQGGTLCTVRPGKAYAEKVTARTKVTDVLVWTAFLKEHKYKEFYWPPSKGDHELSAQFFDRLPEWLQSRKIKPNTPKVFKNGLHDVPEGFQEYRDGKISNYKIVYKI